MRTSTMGSRGLPRVLSSAGLLLVRGSDTLVPKVICRTIAMALIAIKLSWNSAHRNLSYVNFMTPLWESVVLSLLSIVQQP